MHTRRFTGKRILTSITLAAAALTVAQVLFVFAFTEGSSLLGRIDSFIHWDAVWYFRIVTKGYYFAPMDHSISGTNVVFGPAFPLLAYLIHSLVGIPALTSVALASQVAVFIFWTYFLQLLVRWKTPAVFIAVGCLSVLCFPVAFFFVTGFTDSLFLAMLFGMIFWLERDSKYSWLVAAVHGIVMTATRFIGVPLAVLPLLHALFTKGRSGLRDFRPWLAAGISSLGFLSFLAFNQLAFGNWKLPMEAHRYWNTKPNFLAIFEPVFYRHWPAVFSYGTLDPDYVSLMSFQVLLTFLLTSLLLTASSHFRKSVVSFGTPLTLFVAAGLCWYFTLSARWMNISGGVRYMMPVYILTLAGLLWWSGSVRSKVLPCIVFFVLLFVLLFAVPMQANYIQRYLHNLWVA